MSMHSQLLDGRPFNSLKTSAESLPGDLILSVVLVMTRSMIPRFRIIIIIIIINNNN